MQLSIQLVLSTKRLLNYEMKMFCGDNIMFSMETRAFAIESRVLLHQHAMEKQVFIFFLL